MDKETLISFEKKIKDLFKQGKIRSCIHLSGGNEKFLIDIFKHIHRDDWVFSTHRNHYHALLHGIPEEELLSMIINGNSMHINSNKHRFFTSAIVGGVLPIAVGVAMGIKRRGARNHVWVFIGDMCAEMGIFHECQKYARGHDLPITFVVEDNGLSVDTDTQDAWGNYLGKNNVIRYQYKRGYPHCGIGEFVEFNDI